MKKLLFAILCCVGASVSAWAQSGNVPITITEVDGSPRITNPSRITVTNGTLTVNGRNAIIATGGGGGGSPGGSNTQVQYNAAGSFGGAAGFTFNGTSTISLGVAGTSVGAIGFRNATSGTITLQPVTGALGTVTLSLPAVTDTLVGLAATQTLTNKTLTAPVIATIVNTGTLTLPTSTDTLVGRATTDTLSNKTLASPSMTGNLAGETTSQIRFGSNGFRYTNNTGPVFDDTNTGYALTFNVQSLTDNRTMTWPDTALTVAGINVANAWADGVKQTFNPDATNAGINVGSVAGDPSSPANGDLWYDSTANELTARINGANVALGSGGGGGITVGTTTVTSGTATRLFYETAGNVVGQVSGFTSDGTNVTAGSGNLRATLPQITTGLADANGNTMLAFSPTGSATQYLTIANNTATNAVSLTANAPTVAASAQAGTPFNLTASAATAGDTNAGAAAGGSVTITAGNAARLTSGNANGGDITLLTGAGIGTGKQGIVNIGNNADTWLRIGDTGSQGIVLRQATSLLINDRTGANYAGLEVGTTNVKSGTTTWVALANSASGVQIATTGVIRWSSTAQAWDTPDTWIRRNAAANVAFGNTDAASPVAQTLSVQGGTGTNVAGATWTLRGSLGTSQGAPGRIHLTGGAMIAASGTTQQTAVDRIISGATKVLTNNSAVTLVNITNASDTNAGGVIDYCVDVTDGTDQQYECGMVTYGVSNKGGVWSGNTATKFGNHQNATSGTLTVTFAISGANPALLSVNANSSLTPSTGFPRIVYSLRNLTNQAVAVQ